MRRAQLIRPFGVGATMTFPDGVSLMVGGLDHWFRAPVGGRPVDIDEYRVEEWRLEHRLGVDHLRLPPDHRPGFRHREAKANVDLTVPAVRFPQAHVCQRCDRIQQIALTEQGRKRCATCERDGKYGALTQAQFLAMCETGHVQDFPFREWAHRSNDPDCHLPLRLYGLSGSSLVSVFVRCECDANRSLAGVTDALDEDRTVLTHRTDPDGEYRCSGGRPWLGGYHDDACGRAVRGGLRSAANAYFATTVGSVYVPREHVGVPPDVAAALDEPPVSTWIRTLRDVDVEPTAERLRRKYPGLVPASVTDAALDAALRSDGADAQADPEPGSEEEFRLLEYQALSGPRADDRLTVRAPAPDEYAGWLRDMVDRICLIDRLRVTTAFTGFTRIRSDDGIVSPAEIDRRFEMLWADPPPRDERWLPASVVYGEGIFLRFDTEVLGSWASTDEVKRRAGRLSTTFEEVARRRGSREREIPPALVALHTFAHLLIDRLAFEAGYSAASLSERLYISETRAMAGVLVYTAAGDSEGTLGGLVRLGRPGILEPIIRRSLQGATWCSSDPVCSELGDAGGQGPDSCNLAACHDCTLLPETSCEEFNRFLDRQLLVGPTGLFPSEVTRSTLTE